MEIHFRVKKSILFFVLGVSLLVVSLTVLFIQFMALPGPYSITIAPLAQEFVAFLVGGITFTFFTVAEYTEDNELTEEEGKEEKPKRDKFAVTDNSNQIPEVELTSDGGFNSKSNGG